MPKHASHSNSNLARANKLSSTQLNELLGSQKEFTPKRHPDYTFNTIAYHIDDMTPMLQAFAVDLVESNMKELYMKSKDGWCREDKEEEMQDAISRYLITYHNNQPVGMIHFQFVEEETMVDRDAEVVYCFEIQVVPEYQRRGIGAYLIGLLELIGKATQMEKIMLTVFKANKDAIKFYIGQLQRHVLLRLVIFFHVFSFLIGPIVKLPRIRYEYDQISPCQCLTRGQASRFDYEILSKALL